MTKKQKLRKILGALKPQEKADLVAQELKENLKDVVKRIEQVPDYSGSILEFRTALQNISQRMNLALTNVVSRDKLEVLSANFSKEIQNLSTHLNSIAENIRSDVESQFSESKKEAELELEKLITELKRVRLELLNKIGGGNTNREIRINSSVISAKYTDINFKPGSGIVLSKSDDDINKRVDFTIAGTAGGGISSVLGGTGITVDNSASNTPIIALGNSSVTTGTYGSATTVGQFTVDAQGRLSAASTIGITFPTTSPGGSTGQIQYNNAGAFGASSTLTWDASASVLSTNKLNVGVNSVLGGRLQVQSSVVTQIPLITKIQTAQTANWQEWQDGGGTARIFISPASTLSVNSDSNYFALKPGNREYRIGTQDAGGTMLFARSDVGNALAFSPNSDNLQVNPTASASDLILTGGGSGKLYLLGNGSGGAIQIFIGKRRSDSSTAVGASVEFWTVTNQSSPAWAVMIPGGSSIMGSMDASGRLRFNTAAAGTTNEGSLWSDSTQKAVQQYVNNIEATLSGVIFTQTADKSVSNTTTETTIVGSGVGTLTLPANFFVAGKTIRVTMSGVYSTVAVTGDTVTVKVKYGTTVLASKATTSLVTGATNLFWESEILVTCRTTGATGTVQVSGGIRYQVAGSVIVEDELNNTVATTTLDTTSSGLFDITVTHSAADASNTVKSLVGAFEVLN